MHLLPQCMLGEGVCMSEPVLSSLPQVVQIVPCHSSHQLGHCVSDGVSSQPAIQKAKFNKHWLSKVAMVLPQNLTKQALRAKQN